MLRGRTSSRDGGILDTENSQMKEVLSGGFIVPTMRG